MLEKEYFPLSNAQKAMYFLSEAEREYGGTSYNLPVILRLVGHVDKHQMETSLNLLIQRHSSLRSSFVVIDNNLRQETVDTPVTLETDSTTKENLDNVIHSFVRPFHLNQGPLVRAKLVAVTEGDYHILLLDIHHIICDGISMNLVLNDFVRICNNETLTPLSYSYKDFVLWEEMNYPFEAEGLEKYWLNKFSGEIDQLLLPVDSPRTLNSLKGNQCSFTLDEQLSAQIAAFAKRSNVTMYNYFFSVFFLLLYKYTGQNDIVVGTPFAGRTTKETQDIVGMFVNTIAIRQHIDNDNTFMQLMYNLMEDILYALEYQNYPYHELMRQMNVFRDHANHHLFNTMFVFQNMENELQRAKDFEIEKLKYSRNVSPFELTFIIEPGDKIKVTIEYAADLFKQETIERYKSHFENLLVQTVNYPEKQLSAYSAMPEKEKELVLKSGTDTSFLYTEFNSIYSIIEYSIQSYPDNIAISDKNHSITYSELGQMVNSLASSLKDKGVGANQIVAVYMERSIHLIVACLAIMKAGGAYLSIDPQYPLERVKYILEDSNSQLIIVDCYKTLFAEHNITQVQQILMVDMDWNEERQAVVHDTKPEDLAYVIYTSGSTGKPKGVLINHSGFISMIQYHQKIFGQGPGTRMTQVASSGFDAFGAEVWPCLAYGSTLYIMDDEIRLDVLKLQSFILDNQIQITFQSTLMAEQLLQLHWLNQECSLQKLITAGDRLTKFPSAACPFEVYNLYGPTEDTVWTTWKKLDNGTAAEGYPTIGTPVGNHRVYIVSRENQLQPIGIPGEICISGMGLARGYLNNDTLNEQKFINNPFGPGRLYRTGDMGRLLPDGDIEYIGRLDDQVKIRGFRIELGEIENSLLNFEPVREAVAIVKEGPSNVDKMITCYFTAEHEINIKDLRKFLMQMLPSYMIPAHFNQLDSFPVTSNGKIDRKKLAARKENHTPNTSRNADTITEQILLEMYKDILGADSLGVEDNFFELGGHSLKAIQLANVIAERFHISCTINNIFTYPSACKIAGFIDQQQLSALPALQPVKPAVNNTYPVSASQRQMYLVQHISSDKGTVYNVPVMLKLEGKIDNFRIEHAFKQLIARHESFRTSFELEEGIPVQKIRKQVEFKLEEYQDCGASSTLEECIGAIIRPFDLSKPPLIRAALLHYGAENEITHFLIIDIHHIITDGISTNNLLREFKKLYSNEELVPIDIHYKDFAVWQNHNFESELMNEHEAYWCSLLQGDLPVLNWITDYPRPAIPKYDGKKVYFKADRLLSDTLKRTAAENGITVFMLLLAVFQVFLSKMGSQEDVIVGTPVAGRNHPDTEDIIGMFVNTIVMRNQPLAGLSFRSFLNEVLSNALKAYEHQEYPFERLIDKLALDRDISHHPIFDVMFTMQMEGWGDVTLEDLVLSEHRFELPVSKFDLTLNAFEKQGEMYFEFEYATSLFKQATVERFSQYYLKILDQAVNDPDKRIADLELLTEEEKLNILYQFNNTQKDYPGDRCIHQLFEEQAKRTPDNIAIQGKEQRWTYRELNDKADHLAGKLYKEGIRANQVIGILAKRSPDLVLGILAILKAGCAYLPIDPSYPHERIRYMLNNCASNFLLVQQEILLSEGLSLSSADLGVGYMVYSGQALGKDQVWPAECVPYSNTALNKQIHSDSLAYIMYTSGSTGNPKGVMVEHRNVIRLVKSPDYVELREGKRMLLTGSPAFDATTFEIWGTLLNGMQLYLADEDILLRADKLGEFITEKRINFMWLTSPLFRQLAEQQAGIFAPLDALLIGGDIVPVKQVQKVCELCPELTILNMYGPTENTTFSTSYNIKGDISGNIPIGKPISNSTAYIFDPNGKLQPIGLAGELYVGGEGLARGYVNLPEMTAERFVPNPFYPGERLYRTGDLARWLADGNIEFLGRMDQQVKIRGFRIELEEIEKSLTSHPDIRDAVIVVREDQAGNKKLVAYLVFMQKEATSQVKMEKYLNYLERSLPAYMIPASLIPLDHLPLKANGKLDMAALPVFDHNSLLNSNEEDLPQTELQAEIAELLQQLLGIDTIRMHSNLMHLGLNSLMFIRVVMEVERQFGVSLSIMDIMESQSPYELAEKVQNLSLLNRV